MNRLGRTLWLAAGLGCGAAQTDGGHAKPSAASAPLAAPPAAFDAGVSAPGSVQASEMALRTASTAAGVHAAAPLAPGMASSAVAIDAAVPLGAEPTQLAALLASFPPASHSTSIGSATNGRLEGGVPLPRTGPGFRFNDRRNADSRFGTVETVRALVRAAATVARERPGSELVVNDLSLPAGGRIPRHGSHRAGRDADVLFYMLGDDGKPLPAVGAPLEPDGTGFDYKDLSIPDDDVRVHLDTPRTWRVLRALLEDPEAPVQRVFIAEHLRAMLLAQAERESAPAEVIARFAEVTCQPSYPHDDHFHVRWFCSAEDLKAGCEDLPPLYPWRAAELKRAGVAPVLAKKSRSDDPAPLMTKAEAEREVERQAPHPDVLAFLKRRHAWEKQPHPGRPYCP